MAKLFPDPPAGGRRVRFRGEVQPPDPFVLGSHSTANQTISNEKLEDGAINRKKAPQNTTTYTRQLQQTIINMLGDPLTVTVVGG